MAALKDQAQQLKTRQFRLAGTAALLVALAWVLGIRPMNTALADLDDRSKQVQQALDADLQRAAQLPQLKAEVSALRKQVDRFKALPPRSKLSDACRDISTIGEVSRVQAFKYSQETEIRSPLFVEQPIRISFEADFDAAYALVNRLETMDRLTRLRSLKITRKESGLTAVEMTLSLFFSEQ
ncbi:MAG: type 4a pilus biogenesis protein PilO [Tepidisphaeraceae bacterium]